MSATGHLTASGDDRVRRARRIVPRRAPPADQPRAMTPPRIWNGAIDRHPARSPAAPAWPMSSRRCASRASTTWRSPYGAGHNVAGTAVCDDGIVIDLSTMRAVRVDPAVARPGCRLVLLGRRRPRGAGPRSGHHRRHRRPYRRRRTTLGGGIGLLMRKHGLAVDNLPPPTWSPPTAHRPGVRRRTPRLFWALRGGGGNFGSSPRSVRSPPWARRSWPDQSSGRPTTPPTCCASTGTSPPSARRARQRRQARHRPPTAGHPRGPALAAGHRRQLLLRRRRRRRRASGAGPPRVREAARRPARTFAYVAFQSGIDDDRSPRVALPLEVDEPRRLSDDAIAVIADHAYAAGSPRSYVVMFHLGGASPEFPTTPPPMPVAMWPTTYIDAVLPDEFGEYAAAETARARRFLEALQRHRAGSVYVNFLDADDDTSRVREAYGDQTYRRLAEVKAKYDLTTPSTTTRTSSPADARAGIGPEEGPTAGGYCSPLA